MSDLRFSAQAAVRFDLNYLAGAGRFILLATSPT